MEGSELFKVQLNTTAGPWLPHTFYATGTIFLAYNTTRILSLKCTTTGTSGGGTNPDGTYWGYPFTQWLLEKNDVGATIKDGTVMWTIVSNELFNQATPAPRNLGLLHGGIPEGNFFQSTAIGSTPFGFLNYIPPAPFEDLIIRHWDEFESFWIDNLRVVQPLYAVEIVFNAAVLLAGRGGTNPGVWGERAWIRSFDGPRFDPIKKKIGEIADQIGIPPVTGKNFARQLPNLVFIVNPRLPKPGQTGLRERGGRYSNL